MIVITTPEGFKHHLNLVNNAPDYGEYSNSPNTIQVLTEAYLAGHWEEAIIPDPKPMPEPEPTPDWNSFYDGLIMSATYNHLLGLTAVAPNITGAITAMGIALVQGQLDPGNPSRRNALQAAINAVLGVLGEINQPLTTGQLTEVRGLLDDNGFESITLG
jgi:hypothetical protein